MNCKFCNAETLVKYGKRGMVQYYLCRGCGHTFAGKNTLPGMRFDSEHIAAAVHMFYEGLSIDALRKQLQKEYHIYPSDSTVHKWITHFTQIAAGLTKELNVQIGDFWIVGETSLKIYNNKFIWLWDIIDDETNFLLASRMPIGRTMRDSNQLMSRAVKAAGHTPKKINLDKGKAFLDGIEIIFGAETGDLQPSEFAFSPNNSRIERFHGVLEDRSIILRRMKSRETAKQIMEGWLVHYNFFKPQQGLDNKTPGEKAKANFPYRNWKELVSGSLIITINQSEPNNSLAP